MTQPASNCEHQIVVPQNMQAIAFTYDCPSCGELCHHDPRSSQTFMGFHERMARQMPDVWPVDGKESWTIPL